jgi:hydroxymethylpyrimidine pyrophosphatase-like HAD family hydrolase
MKTLIVADVDGTLVDHAGTMYSGCADLAAGMVRQPSSWGVRHRVQPNYLELVGAGVGPDMGVEALRALVPDVKEVIALGDGANDIGMFASADQGFTFADAHELDRGCNSHRLCTPPPRYRELLSHVERWR